MQETRNARGRVRQYRACGVDIVERYGSRVGPMKGGERIVVHRPHPEQVVGRATVRDVAVFLRALGVEP